MEFWEWTIGPLGRSGLKVSPLCLGTMMFGGATDEATRCALSSARATQGVNFIDSADGYNGGRVRALVGRAIRDHRVLVGARDQLANPTGSGPNARGLSRRYAYPRRGRQSEAARGGRDRRALPA